MKLKTKWITPTPFKVCPLIPKEIPRIIQSILSRRGFKDSKDIKEFIDPTEPQDPFLHFPDLDKATNRIITAINNRISNT